MPRVTIVDVSTVVVGDVFTPNLLTPDTLKKFFPRERPRGITTNVITQMEYPQRRVVATLEERKFQVVKEAPRRADLKLLADLVTSFLKANPLVRLTAVGFNFVGFVEYAPGNSHDASERRFISSYVERGHLQGLFDGKIQSVNLQSRYRKEQTLCRLGLRSDAILNNRRGVEVKLNAHRDLGKNDRRKLREHFATFSDWWKYFASVTNALSKEV